jgi:hypothetical protein
MIGQVLVEADGAVICIIEHFRLVGGLKALTELRNMKDIMNFKELWGQL